VTRENTARRRVYHAARRSDVRFYPLRRRRFPLEWNGMKDFEVQVDFWAVVLCLEKIA
jgi:hypothetical protein